MLIFSDRRTKKNKWEPVDVLGRVEWSGAVGRRAVVLLVET
jgi:hypothetical protein